MAWTDERIENLKRLHSERFSNSIIAMRLGGVTRNAVIGKLHRLGLTGGGQPKTRKPFGIDRRRRQNRALSAKKETELALINARRKMRGEPVFATLLECIADQERAKAELAAILSGPEIVVPPHERKTLQQLEDGDCKWPFGDPKEPDFHFGCSGKRRVGLPYCARHAARAYAPEQPRRPPTEHSWGGKKDHPTPSTPFVSKEFDAMEPVGLQAVEKEPA